MRFRRPRRRQERTKTIIFTGGLNDTVTNLELKEGELVGVKNYTEIDSPYHGYSSIPGYEVYDGKTSPSDVNVDVHIDEGNDDKVTLLLEGPTGSVDLSVQPATVENNGVQVQLDPTQFDGGCFNYGGGIHQIVTPNEGASFTTGFDEGFDIGTGGAGSGTQGNLTWDFFIRPAARIDTQILFERPGAYRCSLNSAGFIKFEVSSTSAYVYDYFIEMELNPLSTALFTHVSIVARDGVLRMGINGAPIVDEFGVLKETAYPSIYNTSAKIWIGMGYQGNNPFRGNLDEIRFSNVARWYSEYNVPTLRYSDGNYTEITYYDKDREDQRDTITEVPGSGVLTGIHLYKGEVYALRNDADGTGAALYKANRQYQSAPNQDLIDDTTSGWVLIDDTFNPDGRMQAVNWRFSGSFGDQQVMLIVDGKSVPRIWDGTTMTVVTDINIPDTQASPRYAKVCSIFDNRWVLGYELDDIILSSKTDPADFSGGFGDQLLIGDDITNLKELPGETLGIFCRNSIKVLKKLEIPTSNAGASPDFSFKVENFSRQAGAFNWSVERVLDKIIYADDRGIVDFAAVDKYGDFEASVVSKKLNRTYLNKKQLITTSLVAKRWNHYRLFFSDGYSLWFTFEGEKVKGGTIIQYLNAVNIAVEGEDPDGNLVRFFTSNDGYVYQMDIGTSFNGNNIETGMFSSFYHYASPRNWKTFRRMAFEITAGSRGTIFAVRPVFDYDSPDFPDTQWYDPLTKGFSGSWGEDDWGEFTWGGAAVQEIVHYVRGVGTNMSIEVRTDNKYATPHVIHNCIVDYEQNDQRE